MSVAALEQPVRAGLRAPLIWGLIIGAAQAASPVAFWWLDTATVYALGLAVIGGGQAGLAAGSFLARQGRDLVILEAGDAVGTAWRNRWESLRLFTPVRYDSLPGLTFPGDPDSYPSRDDVVEPNLVWKDTVLVRTGETVDILLDVTNPGRWMAHCHIAEHHESGMMFSFDVVR